jgi:hypothetical protein
MKYFFLIFFFLCLTFVSCDTSKKNEIQPIVITPTSKTYSDDEITAFKQLTIKSPNANIITKLPTRISIFLVDTTYSYMTQELDSIIVKMNKLLNPNLIIDRTNDKNISTLQVYLTDRATYIRAEPSAASYLENSNFTTGLSYAEWDINGLIYHGSVFIDMSKTSGNMLWQRHIIHHEMMHSLGFRGHVYVSQFKTVLFNYTLTPFIIDFTDFDKKMMLLLYNPAIESGIKEVDFDSIVKKL